MASKGGGLGWRGAIVLSGETLPLHYMAEEQDRDRVLYNQDRVLYNHNNLIYGT